MINSNYNFYEPTVTASDEKDGQVHQGIEDRVWMKIQREHLEVAVSLGKKKNQNRKITFWSLFKFASSIILIWKTYVNKILALFL